MRFFAGPDSRARLHGVAEAAAKVIFFVFLSELLIISLPSISPAVATGAWCVWFPAVMWFAFVRRTEEEFFLGLRARARRLSRHAVANGAALTGVYCAGSIVAQVLYVSLVGGPDGTSDIEMTLYRPGGWVPFGLIAVVLAPIVEEAALRGYFQGRLEATYGKRTALCGGALLFALLHGSLIGMPFYFADGVVLGLVAMRTGSIWVSTAMHASANLAVLVASLRFGAGSSAADVPKQTGVPLVVFLPVLAGLAAAFIWLLSRSAMRRATAHASYDAVVPPSIP